VPSALHRQSPTGLAFGPCHLTRLTYVNYEFLQLHLRHIRLHVRLTRPHPPHLSGTVRVDTNNSKFVWNGVRFSSRCRCTSLHSDQLIRLNPRTIKIQVSAPFVTVTVAVVVTFSKLIPVRAILELVFV
jgi:hypothetical protein